jgi:hypothetical protein
MSLNESHVEDAALEWFGEQCRVAPNLTRPLPREEEAEREAIRRLNPAIPEEASACALHADRRATDKRHLQVQIERRLNP